MSNVLKRPTRMTVDQYLALQQASPARHEYIGGMAYPIDSIPAEGDADRHNTIQLNLAAFLSMVLPDDFVVSAGTTRVRIGDGSECRHYAPDAVVARPVAAASADRRSQPVVIAEVLAPHTERVDRIEKFHAYRELPSVEEVIFVSQDSDEVEVFRRRWNWRSEIFHRDDTLYLESFAVQFPVSQLYRRVTLPAASTPEHLN